MPALDGPPYDLDGKIVPAFMYGTAWKEEATEGLVTQALAAGFRAIDTANQRKHYHEAGVGAALRAAFAAGTVQRDEVFLQTKFTHIAGQDHRLPYDPQASLTDQVAQSFASSLEHLGVEALDSYVLHGPSTRFGLAPQDVEAWRAMEDLQRQGKTRVLGVSNVSAEQLEELIDLAEVKPRFVQNRCYARLGWDRAVREVCAEHDVIYQGFSLLTANRAELHHPVVQAACERSGGTVAQVVFALARALGMVRLTGTTDPEHMREDLDGDALALTEDEVRALERVSG